LLLVAAFLLPCGPLAQNPETKRYVSPWKTPWTYAEANRWSELDPDYAVCNVGKEQSPIDIRHAQRAKLPALRFEYKTSPLKYVIHNGHTIRVNYHDAPGSGNFLIVGDQRYQLAQFHFHRPSEKSAYSASARSMVSVRVFKLSRVGDAIFSVTSTKKL
jgi:carbonic anhydrase